MTQCAAVELSRSLPASHAYLAHAAAPSPHPITAISSPSEQQKHTSNTAPKIQEGRNFQREHMMRCAAVALSRALPATYASLTRAAAPPATPHHSSFKHSTAT
jgi:hypothetical protein